MKKILLCMISVLAIMNTSLCLGQTNDVNVSEQEGIFNKYREVSVSASIIASTLQSQQRSSLSPDMINCGGIVSVDEWFHRSWAFSYGLQYTIGGMTGVISEGVRHLDAEDKLHYIGIPLLVKFKPTKDPGFVIGAGFRPDLLISAKEDYYDFLAYYPKDVRDEYNKFDCKFVMDISYTFPNGVKFGLERDYGLCNVGNTRLIINDSKYTNQSVILYVGYRF